MEFDHRWISASNTPGGEGAMGNVTPWSMLGNVIDDVRDGTLLQRGGNRDAWFRLRYPEDLEPLLHISVAVYATERGSRTPALVGVWNNRGEASSFFRVIQK
ncbi:hypothetical protein [Luteimonas terrae]|uniref:Uncharacterized protein n=1 Tax=Luteimonas terrae TaxID=1530191 RepID=A0ABU1XVM5_9GAMM|nr:hypothetical protein [Luteimonas terrae]MDR7192658.1 hypothetical protein [Luteimonas terrae]